MEKYQFQEIASSVYAWDLHDEGTECVLDNLQSMANVNSVYLIALMHEERHPWPNDTFFPHNPCRKEYQTEDSVAYWPAQPENYGRILPSRPTNFLAGTDWLGQLGESAKRRGMRFGVEMSHTMLGSDRLASDCLDVRQVDLFGEPLRRTHIGENHFVPCMNHPDFRLYVQNLFREVIKRYNVDYVLNCIMPYPMPAPYLLVEYEDTIDPREWILRSPVASGCFCKSCVEKAKEIGFDLLKARDGLLKLSEEAAGTPPLYETNITPMELLLDHQEFIDWLRFKEYSVSSFYKELHCALHAAKPDIDNRMNLYITSHSEYAGFRPKKVAKYFDSIRVCVYTENLGESGLALQKRKVLNAARRAFGPGAILHSAIGVLPGATPESVREGIRVSAECGAQSISLGHYDGATFEMLKMVGDVAEHR